MPLQQALRHLERAFVNFFEGRADYPTFKKKRDEQSATYAANAFTWDGQFLTLAKMEAPLDIHWHRPLPITPRMVGLDLGLTSFMVTSDGKARRKVARIHARRADRRRDYQHQQSHRITLENQVICVESLAKSIADVGWGEFVRQLGYKAKWYARTPVKIDQWFPSSKTCHACKYVLSELDLSVREWVCPNCGALHQRDHNAAKNVSSEGLSALNACGGDVRPVPVRAGQAVTGETGTSAREGRSPAL